MMTDLTSVKASIDPHPPSRPRPEDLYPPNGVLGITVYSLTPTVPARTALATRKARAMLVVKTPAPSPYSVSLAKRMALLFVIEGHRHEHRSEDLFARHGHRLVHIGEERRVDEVALGEIPAGTVATGDQTCPFTRRLFDETEHAVELALVDDGSRGGRRIEGITQR